MKRVPVGFLTLLVLLGAPVYLAAKAEMLRIVIRGEGLSAPVEITDRAALDRFHMGHGPGNFRGEADGSYVPNYSPQGFIIDWSKGAVEPPKGQPVYEVSFVTSRQNPSTYIVHYVIDAATNS